MVITEEQKTLARYRFERAEVTIQEAIDALSRNDFILAVNRGYYAVFYAMRAFLATINVDSSKHSGVMSLFNQHFIRSGIVSEMSYKSIQSLFDLRHEGDYQDFAVISAIEAKEAVDIAINTLDVLQKIIGIILEK